MGRSGGGVAFYLSDFLRASILCSSAGSLTVKPEFIAAEVLFEDSSKLLLAVVYRPPNSGYLNEFFQLFLELQVSYRHSMILGDFNADMNQVTFDSQQLSAFISASSLYLVPFSSTHHLRNSSTLLDLCIIDDVDKLKGYGQHGAAFLSAHDLIHLRYEIKLQRRRSKLVNCRDWRGFDAASFQSDIDGIDWTDLLSSDNLEDKIDMFNARLLDIFNLHVPLRRRHFRNLPAPWLTEDIRAAMRSRDLARRAWRRHKNDEHYNRYKVLRNEAHSLVRSAKSAFYMNILTLCTRGFFRAAHQQLETFRSLFDAFLTSNLKSLHTQINV